MTQAEVKGIIEKSIRELLSKQPEIVESTLYTGATEWNIGHHLAYILHNATVLSGFHCDLDITKHHQDNKRPDIIFHKRNSQKYNFLVIELKFDKPDSELQEVEQKIRESWFSEGLKYRFGAAINIHRDKTFLINLIENVNGCVVIHTPLKGEQI